MSNVSREEYEATVAHWRELGVGVMHEDELPGGVVLASMRRDCLPDEAVHLAGWTEVQALLATGSHYTRSHHGGRVYFTIYISSSEHGR